MTLMSLLIEKQKHRRPTAHSYCVHVHTTEDCVFDYRIRLSLMYQTHILQLCERGHGSARVTTEFYNHTHTSG